MLYFMYKNDALVEITNNHDRAHYCEDNRLVVNRNDFGSIQVAEKVAAEATEMTGNRYIAIDAGSNVSPRYDVIEAPKVGDEVSYAFNGDYYPDGEIVQVSDSLRRVVTSTGGVYWRKRQTGAWKKDKTWTMVRGHIDRRNPHF